ncbi:MAG: T9SS type A sorting domain-containing protein, partial [Bacteroidetes bacterium]|nr:T9SS type A sorting domain-containing protein [Bacteroidota bacterium]
GDDVILSASAADSYLWSDGSATQTITVNSTGDYFVTVTTNGCTSVSEPVTVTVNNYPCGKDKLLICHLPPGNSSNPKTICINKNALPAHLAHGDYCGPCAENKTKSILEDDWCGYNPSDFFDSIFDIRGRDYSAYIPTDSTPVKYFSVLVIVIDSATYGVSQENIDTMMAGTNRYFEPWKISFCYNTNFVDTYEPTQYPINGDSIFNVVVYNWPNGGLSGNPIKIHYSMVTNNDDDGRYVLAHELGHNFQLGHTFSVTEQPASDPYYGCSYLRRDRVDYMPYPTIQDTIGDYIRDTPPTPRNTDCAPPTGVDSCSVGNPPWPDWGYENIMGYSKCPHSFFTPQQAGRMHLFISYGNSLPTIFKYESLLAYGDLHCNPATQVVNRIVTDNEYLTVVPNPFINTTTISFATMHDDVATLEIWSYTGQYISTIFNNSVIGGQKNQVEFSSDYLPAGVYFAKLKTSNLFLVKSLVIIK